MTLTQEWYGLACIAIAVALALVVGAERAFYNKDAGIRTHTLVALGAAVFTVVSKYGFADVIAPGTTGGDGSRVAAQIVSGVGFLGAGLIFVKRGSVRGLTTAASIWLVAAVGMAAGAGLWLVAVGVTGLYLVVTLGARPLHSRLPHARSTRRALTISYDDGCGVLREIVHTIGSHGIQVCDLSVVASTSGQTSHGGEGEIGSRDGQRQQRVVLELSGSAAGMRDLIPDLDDLPGVRRLWSAARDDLDA